jgi:hypothetical protein
MTRRSPIRSAGRAVLLCGLFGVGSCGDEPKPAAPPAAPPSAPIAASGATPAAPATGTIDGPRITSDQPFLNLGDLLLGAERTVSFPLRNAGTQPLVIRRIETTCGCTLARMLDATGEPIGTALASASPILHTLAPGDRCTVEMKFVSAGQAETRLRKQTKIVSNDPNQPEFVLEIEVNLMKAFTVEPASVVFGEIVRGETPSKDVRVVPDVNMAAVELSGFADVPAWIDPTLSKVDGGWNVTLRVRTDAPIGYLQPTLRVLTSDATFSSVPIQVAITVKSPVVFDTGDASRREVLDFGPVAAGSTHERTIEVKNTSTELVRLSAVKVDSKRADAITAVLETVEEGRHYRIKVTLKAPADAKSLRGSLEVTSDSPLLPVKILPFQAWIAKSGDPAH